MSDNRREYFRVAFDHLINGEISIQSGAFAGIKIDNLSVGGMSFVSDAQLLMHEKVLCRFTILERSFSIKGVIVRKSIKTNYTVYGVEFNIDPETASALFQQLNFYQIRQRRKGDL